MKPNRKKEFNKRKKYTNENLLSALKAVKNGMSKKLAAKTFSVPRGTIQSRLRKPCKDLPGPNPILSDEEEGILVKWVVDCSRKGFPKRKADLQLSVANFLKKAGRENPFKDGIPGKKWYDLFMRRHPELSERTAEAVTSASANVSETDIKGWFQKIEMYLKENKYFDILQDPSRVFNGDESNFQLCPKSGKVISLRGEKDVYEVDHAAAKTALTVLFTFAADGDVTPPLVVFPNKRLPKDITLSVPNEWGIGLSDSGWMKSELFYDYIKNVFHPYLIKRKIKLPVILFVDGHKTHLSLEVSELCSKLEIVLIALYPNATRILQPADVSAFRPLKAAWKESVLKWRRDHPLETLTKNNFVPVLKEALEVGVKDSTVINGFRTTGLCPWNPESINYNKCLGKPSKHSTEPKQDTPKPQEILNEDKVMTAKTLKQIVGQEKIAFLQGAPIENLTETEIILKNICTYFEKHPSTSQNANSDMIPIENKEAIQILPIDQLPIVLAEDLADETQVLNTIAMPNNSPGNNTEDFIGIGQQLVFLDSQQFLLTPVKLQDVLVTENTPERKGVKTTERSSFVLTSAEWQKTEKDKLKAKQLKEEEQETQVKATAEEAVEAEEEAAAEAAAVAATEAEAEVAAEAEAEAAAEAEAEAAAEAEAEAALEAEAEAEVEVEAAAEADGQTDSEDSVKENNKNESELKCEESKRLTASAYNEDERLELAPPPPPPDGGYGWVIVAASFLCNMVLDGIGYSFGIFLPELVTYFGQGKGTVAWVGSLLAGMFLGVGPVVSALCNKYGCRAVCIAGSIVATTAFVLSSFSTSVPVMMLTYGLFGGIGFGMIYLPSIVAVGYYFESKRSLATGIAVCGSGVGTFAFAPLATWLLNHYGSWQSANLLLAGLLLNCAVCGALMRPLTYDSTPSNKPLLQRMAEEKRLQMKRGSLAGQHLANVDPGVHSSLNLASLTRVPTAPGNMPNVPTLPTISEAGPRKKVESSQMSRNVSSPGFNAHASGLQRNGSVPYSIGDKQKMSTRAQSKVSVMGSRSVVDAESGMYTSKASVVKEVRIIRPMSRKDIFYSGSILNLPEYQSQRSLQGYRNSVLNLQKTVADGRPGPPEGSGCAGLLSTMFEVRLLKDKAFMLINFSNMLAMAGLYVPFVYMVDAAKLSGVDANQAPLLLSIIGITNTVGRILFGWVADFPWVDSLFVTNLCLFFCTLSVAAIPFCASFGMYVGASTVFGFAMSGFISLTSIVLVDLVGLDSLSAAFGLLLLFRGVATLLGSPLAGAVFDATKSYSASFYMAAAFFGIATVASTVSTVFRKKPEPIVQAVPLSPINEELEEDEDDDDSPISM